jgi:hypothetical protein
VWKEATTLGHVARSVDVSELVGAAEIAERLGLNKPSVVHDWRQRHDDFPKPIARLRMGLVWAWPDVERWAKKTERL